MEKRIAVYEDFGAIGDGIHDDIEAIKACHDYANANSLDVYATDGRTYYIGGKDVTAVIKTNTHWGAAKFIIDDRNLENIKQSIFSVEGDTDMFTPEINSLVKNQKNVDFSHTGKVFVRVFNENKRVYIRKGLNQNNGTASSDCFAVDECGRVLCGINWDYPTITRAYAKSADDKPIVIEGGIFTTVANNAESFYNYHSRNIDISRSNVTVRKVTHYVEGEGEHGAPYTGFICVNECCNFTLEDCLLSPHFTYWTASKIPGRLVPMGTYDISIGAVVGLTLRGIRQTKDITDSKYWGLMGSNFSKEVVLEDCVMSRYDAHCGVTNAKIKNCSLGHHGVNLIGFGDFVIENSTVYAHTFINLRSDYGSFFEGEVTVKNCTWVPRDNTRCIIGANNTGDHDFGYTCSMPYRINIDGLTIEDSATDGRVYILPRYDDRYATDKPCAYIVPETVNIKNIVIRSRRELELAEFPEMYLNTQVECD